jgi:hypothetical protein
MQELNSQTPARLLDLIKELGGKLTLANKEGLEKFIFLEELTVAKID